MINIIKIKKKLKEIFFIVLNVNNFYVIHVLEIIKLKISIILIIIKDMMLYVKYIQIYMIFIVLNVKRIYVFIVKQNINIMI